MIYYPVACHNQNMFANLSAKVGQMTVTDSLTPNVISLPIHTEMEEEQLKFITDAVLEYINK
jgi:UDP-2-acetamido-2-deoxy-ribo-hexuluronate aminotransferase